MSEPIVLPAWHLAILVVMQLAAVFATIVGLRIAVDAGARAARAQQAAESAREKAKAAQADLAELRNLVEQQRRQAADAAIAIWEELELLTAAGKSQAATVDEIRGVIALVRGLRIIPGARLSSIRATFITERKTEIK